MVAVWLNYSPAKTFFGRKASSGFEFLNSFRDLFFFLTYFELNFPLVVGILLISAFQFPLCHFPLLAQSVSLSPGPSCLLARVSPLYSSPPVIVGTQVFTPPSVWH